MAPWTTSAPWLRRGSAPVRGPHGCGKCDRRLRLRLSSSSSSKDPRDEPSPCLEFNMHTPDEIAARLLAVPYEALDERAKKVARHIAARTHIARNVAKEFDAQPTPGQRAADAVASFGGSWTFVGLFAAA